MLTIFENHLIDKPVELLTKVLTSVNRLNIRNPQCDSAATGTTLQNEASDKLPIFLRELHLRSNYTQIIENIV